MKSLALWYKPKIEIQDRKTLAEIHFNIWKIPVKKRIIRKKEFDRFIDLGISLNNTKEIEKLFIYYPQKLLKSDILDLGTKIVNTTDKKLINTIFNENLSIKSEGNSAYHLISDSSGNEKFSIYEINENNIKVSPLNHGTRIEITFGGKTPNNTYIRIRIKKDFKNLFSNIDKPSNSIFQSAFTKSETLDFRINEARELTNELLETIDSEGFIFHFSKIHFFFICCSKEEFMFSHVPFISCRQLEKDRWKDYIGNNQSPKSILAYHWKVKDSDGINDFNALVQTRYENNSWRTIVIYIGILFILTVSFNIFSNYFYERIFHSNDIDIEKLKNYSLINNDSTLCKH